MNININKLKKYIALKGIRHWILVMLLFIGALEGGAVAAKYSDQIASFINPSQNQENIPPSITPVPVDTNSVDCFTKGSNIRMTETECLKANGFIIEPTIQPTKKVNARATIDPDPIIDCKFTYIGTLRLKRSVCSTSTDCQINGKWYYYASVEKCKQDQKTYWNNPNYVYSTSAPYPTWKPFATYAPYPTYAPYASPTMTSEQAQSIIDQHNSQVLQCRDNVANKYYGTIEGCNNRFGDSSARVACIQTYESQRNAEYANCGSTY